MTLTANVANAALNDHQAWLESLRSMHAALMESPHGLPAAPLAWGERPEPEVAAEPSGFGGFGQIGHFDERFGAIALSDEDFDAPVYRSLSFAPEDAPFGFGAFASEDEHSPQAVYRSLSGPQRANSARRDAAPMSAEEADRAWLETMPPLIKRQKAHHVSGIALP